MLHEQGNYSRKKSKKSIQTFLFLVDELRPQEITLAYQMMSFFN